MNKQMIDERKTRKSHNRQRKKEQIKINKERKKERKKRVGQ